MLNFGQMGDNAKHYQTNRSRDYLNQDQGLSHYNLCENGAFILGVVIC